MATFFLSLSRCGVHVRNLASQRNRNIHCRRLNTHTGEKEYSKNSTDGENAKFSWNQVLLQWALGMYASTPLIAIFQGSLLLNDYRTNYSDAPRPVMPARGVAIAIDEGGNKSSSKGTSTLSSWILHPFSSTENRMHVHSRPLRLLVVGDSLAAGVGMSKSGVPILPESIARELSKEMGGRTVYWTCVGTPGVSAAQIVKDIEEIEPYDPNPKGRQLERIVKEFQHRRRQWIMRSHQSEESESLQKESDEVELKALPNAIQLWWKRIRQTEKIDSKSIQNTTQQVLRECWASLRRVFQQRKQSVEEDLSTIKEMVMNPLPQLDDEDDEYYYDYYRENLDSEGTISYEHQIPFDSSKGSDRRQEKRIPLVRRGSLFRRTSVIPEAAAEYDIAIVLTGLNDVKEAFLPHMNSGGDHETKRLEGRLRQVLEALQEKMGGTMNLRRSSEVNTDIESSTEVSKARNNVPDVPETGDSSKRKPRTRHPLVVVPELPVAPLQLFQLVPLCWFLIPIFRAMENNKRFLASCFPDNVVFVHQPDLDWWTNDEMGIGSIRENIKNEQLLLRVTDSVRSGRERIEELMRSYYSSKEDELTSATTDRESASNCSKVRTHNNRNGSDLVSLDKIHPNDEGYELWGRHIARAIIAHWKIKETNDAV